MTKQEFITRYLPLAQKAGEAFRINPVVILAQAAIETGWGQSDLCLLYHNFSVSPPTVKRTSGGPVPVRS